MKPAIYEDDTVCILSVLHPARAQSRQVDVAKTWAEHEPVKVETSEQTKES